MYTQSWYEGASEKQLLAMAHVYGPLDSQIVLNDLQRSERLKHNLPGTCFAIKGSTVTLTSTLVLSYLQKYGYVLL